nr:protein LURP-one-related 14 [Ziziphus jujuba var. spinosa]
MEAPELAYGVPIVSIVRDDFCVPYPVEFVVKKKNHGLFHVKYQVLDVNGKLYLHVDGFQRNMQKKRLMSDAAGFPLLTMSEKVLTPNHQWMVHRGESSERNEFLFSVQRSYTFQMRSRLDVFLPTNINEDVSNFQIVECHSSQFYRIYKGETVIAERNYNFTWGSFCKGKENFRVKIYP